MDKDLSIIWMWNYILFVVLSSGLRCTAFLKSHGFDLNTVLKLRSKDNFWGKVGIRTWGYSVRPIQDLRLNVSNVSSC